MPPFVGGQGSLARNAGIGSQNRGNRRKRDHEAQTPNGYVSGTPAAWPAGRGVTARVSSNQTKASNCSASTASK